MMSPFPLQSISRSQAIMRQFLLLPTVVFLICFPPLHRAETRCMDHAEAAIQIAKGDGLSVICCAPHTLDCHPELQVGECDESLNETWVYCIGGGGSQACSVIYGLDPDLPCGAYAGSSGPTFGVSATSEHYQIQLLNSDIQASVQRNWNRLTTLPSAVLCCFATDIPQAPGCHPAKRNLFNVNVCNRNEYELKCAGTSTAGVCTVYNNTTPTDEIGQYYLVNFDSATTRQPLVDSQSVSDTSSSITTSSNVTGNPSETSPPSTPQSAPSESPSSSPAAKRSGIRPVVIAVPIAAVIVVLLAAMALYAWHRHLVASRVGAHPISPYPPAPPAFDTLDTSRISSPGHSQPALSTAAGVAPVMVQPPSSGKRIIGADLERATHLPAYI